MIDTQKAATPNTKRSYSNLAEYAAVQGAPAAAFAAAGWRDTVHKRRPAITFPTDTGQRWRFIDGKSPHYISAPGYRRSWYRLTEACSHAGDSAQPMVFANGEAGVIVAQHYGIAATAITSGEKGKIPDDLLTQLQQEYPTPGKIIIALDCDETGWAAAAGLLTQLRGVGYQVQVVDLQLDDGGDIANFCTLHGAAARDLLPSLPAPDLPAAPHAPRPDLHFRRVSPVGDYGSVWKHIKAQIIPERLGITDTRTNADGFTLKRIANPFVAHERDHRAPASVYNFESGVLFDHKGGHTYTARQLCDLLNIDQPARQTPARIVSTAVSRHRANTASTPRRADLPAVQLPRPREQIKPPAKPVWYRQRLTQGIVDVMVGYAPEALPIINLIAEAALHCDLNPANFTAAYLLAADSALGYGIGENAIRRTLTRFSGVFWNFSQNPPVEKDITTTGEKCEKLTRGRKMQHYHAIENLEDSLKTYCIFRIIEKAAPAADHNALLTISRAMLKSVGEKADRLDALNSLLRQHLPPEKLLRTEKRLAALQRSFALALSKAKPAAHPGGRLAGELADHALSKSAHFLTWALHARVCDEIDPDNPDTYPGISALADHYGVSRDTIRTALKAGAVKIESQIVHLQLPTDSETPLAEVSSFARERRAKPLRIVATTGNNPDDGQRKIRPVTPRLHDTVQQLAAENRQIFVEFNAPAKLQATTPTPPPPAQRQPRQRDLLPPAARSTPVSPDAGQPGPATPKPRRSRHFGPGHDPAWVLASVIKIAVNLAIYEQRDDGLYRDEQRIDDPTPGAVLADLLAWADRREAEAAVHAQWKNAPPPPGYRRGRKDKFR